MSFAGDRISDVRKLQDSVARAEPKKKVEIRIIREGREMPVQLVPGEMPQDEETVGAAEEKGEPAPGKGATYEWEGVKISEINESTGRQFDIRPGEKGCVVTDVSEGSLGEQIGFVPGDLIYFVNKIPVKNIKEFQAAVKTVKFSEGVVFDINRQGRLLYLSYLAER